MTLLEVVGLDPLRRRTSFYFFLFVFCSSSFLAAQEVDESGTQIIVDGGSSRLAPTNLKIRAAKDQLWKKALEIHYNALVVDGHVDTPTLMIQQSYDIGEWHAGAAVDIPRMNSGGLDAAFFAIFTPAYTGNGLAAFNYVTNAAKMVKDKVDQLPSFAEMARSADDVIRITKDEKKAVILALEGGHLLSGDIARVQELYDMGIRYVTLTHNRSHSWSDSALDLPIWNGISDVGDKIIREMNRVGMIIDVSHSSEDVINDVLKITTSPIIASHSSASALVDTPRNLSDEAIVNIAKSGGIVMVNFYDMLVNTALDDSLMAQARKNVDSFHGGNLRMLYRATYQLKTAQGLRNASIEDVIDHIEYIVDIAGIEHVGLGSDFDGAAGPVGLENVSKLPIITYHLLKRGYSSEDIYRLLGSNVIRVMKTVENNRF